MPPALVKAHQNLDKAVDAAYVAAEKAAGRKAPSWAATLSAWRSCSSVTRR